MFILNEPKCNTNFINHGIIEDEEKIENYNRI